MLVGYYNQRMRIARDNRMISESNILGTNELEMEYVRY